MSAEAMQTAASFVQHLAGDLNTGDLELPMFPDSVVRIQKAFQAEEVDIDEIVQLIGTDPGIAARVLQLANSAAVRGAAEIKELRQAVIRLGNKMVQSSVLTFALRQAERNEKISRESRQALHEIWEDSVELAARCHVIAKEYTKLRADEAMLTGLLSVIGRLYILWKYDECAMSNYAELETILSDWHPTIGKAIVESWNMADEIASALELQLETDPPLQESATYAEVLCAARLIFQNESLGEPLVGSEYPLLQRLGIADYEDSTVTLDAHAVAIEAIRQGLRG
ncbi:MAG: HDOD domain-containing protein [Woeseiaceae bacterium]|nr:HDOD domain-containing protein [Woeseiaceae bacterium]